MRCIEPAVEKRREVIKKKVLAESLDKKTLEYLFVQTVITFDLPFILVQKHRFRKSLEYINPFANEMLPNSGSTIEQESWICMKKDNGGCVWFFKKLYHPSIFLIMAGQHQKRQVFLGLLVILQRKNENCNFRYKLWLKLKGHISKSSLSSRFFKFLISIISRTALVLLS